MKRTAEKILIWIGIILQLILIFLMAIVAPFFNDVSVKNELIEVINQSNIYNQNASQMDPANIVDLVSNLFILALIVVIVCTVIAIIFAILTNKLPKFVGIIFILLGLVTVLTLNWITAILWLVAGILLLVRKKQKSYDRYQPAKGNIKKEQAKHHHNNQKRNTETRYNEVDDHKSEEKDKAPTQLSRKERYKK
ncbi:glucan phosphoethanolaminetransferase (alkaline phosphatase superfamily) [Staphylococcus saprophyticus]|uniref:DUF4064 domain-containing protein n=1 Tax=Staphylococcus saprophyticus TaxID=29385 RepID=UPI00085A6847|nr:DUF4064 domain-containing protein [Staphylococcus saprophyticus]MBN6851210.1 DUF4064 domain-containing protein [Staphylococcus saprophyticus]MDW3892911.1 DUF4064 domain-containing protein [Staphylococcus saprophyticus]MDW3920264.1 DUF4064 domain-containing protein [Staphylococcus saprophyticus]MDW3932677.1 DUF4064 domain-containing protein [Staphylococcus saprophyticus]MDW3957982.1 DUF4064 domain-containing protein [Staphylococcus saprophyticus]